MYIFPVHLKTTVHVKKKMSDKSNRIINKCVNGKFACSYFVALITSSIYNVEKDGLQSALKLDNS